MTLEEEKAFLEKHAKAAGEGKHVTVQTMHYDYVQIVGYSVTRECLYALLKRYGWHKVTPPNIRRKQTLKRL